jgi:glycerol-3-phosphate dehydrogenase (NAD(P)+)
MIGKGYSVKTASLEIGMISEGYYATKSLMEMNEKFQVDLPILTAVFQIIYANRSARKTMQELAEKLS